jgi:hypothetical protein
LRDIIIKWFRDLLRSYFQWRRGRRTDIIKVGGSNTLGRYVLASYYILQVDDDSQRCIHLRIDNDAFGMPLHILLILPQLVLQVLQSVFDRCPTFRVILSCDNIPDNEDFGELFENTNSGIYGSSTSCAPAQITVSLS